MTDKPYTDSLPPPVPERTIKVDLTDSGLEGFPGDPVTDVVITDDDAYGLVVEHSSKVSQLKGKLRHFATFSAM